MSHPQPRWNVPTTSGNPEDWPPAMPVRKRRFSRVSKPTVGLQADAVDVRQTERVVVAVLQVEADMQS